MITIDGGTGLIMNNGVEIASEKMVDEWKINANVTQGSGAQVITSSWERNNRNFTLIGKGMTESSGIFTFPITGIFLIRAAINFFSDDGARAYMGCIIDASTDSGSSFSVLGNNYTSTASTNYYTAVTAQAVFDVTDTSTHQIRMKTNLPAGNNTVLSADYQRTCISFTRIGNT